MLLERNGKLTMWKSKSSRLSYSHETWLLGENSVQFLTLGQIWKSLLPFISYQFDAFFSYFYTLKHENFLRIRKYWWHLQAEHAFINTRCMKMGYNRGYQAWNTCVFVLVECLDMLRSINPIRHGRRYDAPPPLKMFLTTVLKRSGRGS